MYIIFCRDDGTTAPEDHPYRMYYSDGRVPGKFQQATRKTFSSLTDAMTYAKGYAQGRDAFVLHLDPTGCESLMHTVGDFARLTENTKRVEVARNVGIDWG